MTTRSEQGQKMDYLSNCLTNMFDVRISVDFSDNGDDDWKCPVFAAVDEDFDESDAGQKLADAYGLCDLESDTLDNQLAFLAKQISETLGPPKFDKDGVVDPNVEVMKEILVPDDEPPF